MQKEGTMRDGLKDIIDRLNTMDLFLAKLAVFFATIIMVKALPQLLKIDGVILVILMLVCAAKPFYDGWIRDKWSKRPSDR